MVSKQKLLIIDDDDDQCEVISATAQAMGFPALPGGGPPSLFQLDYSQSIFNPLLKGQQKAAEDRAKSQKLEIDKVQDDVIVRTASAYLELAKVQHSMELMENERASAGKQIQHSGIAYRIAVSVDEHIEQ